MLQVTPAQPVEQVQSPLLLHVPCLLHDVVALQSARPRRGMASWHGIGKG